VGSGRNGRESPGPGPNLCVCVCVRRGGSLQVLHEYEEKQTGPEFLMSTVKKLFADHPDLLQEFAFFLPPGSQELLPQQDRLSQASLGGGGGGAHALGMGGGGGGPAAVTGGEPDMTLAVDFLNKVNQRFIHERDKYQLFLELLHEYERGRIPPEQVMATVNTLLADHVDLCREFALFLPERKAKMADFPAAPVPRQQPAGGGLGAGVTDVNFAMLFVNKVRSSLHFH
jgi:hypothetical protein